MRLEHLISGINEEMLAKIQENQKTKENLGISTEEAENTAKMVALAAIKYGDLSNQASKDTSLILTALLLLREIQAHTSCIRSSVSNRS